MVKHFSLNLDTFINCTNYLLLSKVLTFSSKPIVRNYFRNKKYIIPMMRNKNINNKFHIHSTNKLGWNENFLKSESLFIVLMCNLRISFKKSQTKEIFRYSIYSLQHKYFYFHMQVILFNGILSKVIFVFLIFFRSYLYTGFINKNH